MEDKKKEKLFMRDFFRKAGKAIYDYELIEPGDSLRRKGFFGFIGSIGIAGQ